MKSFSPKASFERLSKSKEPHIAFGALEALGDEKAEIERRKIASDPRVDAIIRELQTSKTEPLSSHKSPVQPFQRLSFLSAIGITSSDNGMPGIIEKISSSFDDKNIPTLPMQISESHGGTGECVGAWALCDAPVTMSALYALGCRDPRLDKGVAHLASLSKEYGWGCEVSLSLGKWRGPGKKTDPCPFATLAMLKLISRAPVKISQNAKITDSARAGIASILDLWEHSLERHPYIFYMGTDFRKLKYPFVWYDILHVASVLSDFETARIDSRFTEMIDLILASRSLDGGFVPQSVWMAYKGWDFGQKKAPSDTMELEIAKIVNRL